MKGFGPDVLWYIKLRDYGDRSEQKKPAEAWGGYDTDFEENPDVYTYEETQESDHDRWAVVGTSYEEKLVIIDVDAHKIDDFETSDLGVPSEDDALTIVESRRKGRDIPGYHFYILVDGGVDIKSAKDWVDIKANKQGHVVSPFHADDYQITRDDDLFVYRQVGTINQHFSYQGKQLVTSGNQYSGGIDLDVDIDIPDEPPEKLPFCLQRCLTQRRDIARDGSFSDPWKLDSAAGRRLVAHGYSKQEAMNLLREYPPQDGFDAGETAYQLDRLYQKQLHPDSTRTLRELGVFDDDEWCDCEICVEIRSRAEQDRIDEITSKKLIASKKVSDLDEVDKRDHLTLQGTARSGKSYSVIGRAVELMDDDDKIVYLAPAHTEAKETFDKIKQQGIEPGYIVGERHAREEYDIQTSGTPDPSFTPTNPEQAAERDGINAYQCLIQSASQQDVVVTVPELLGDIDGYNWVIMSEEKPFQRMTHSSINIIDIKRNNGYDRKYGTEIVNSEDKCQNIIDEIDQKDQTDHIHDTVRQACQVVVDLSNIVKDWVPSNWQEVSESWDELVADVESRLEDAVYPDETTFEQLHKRLQNYDRTLDNLLLNVRYCADTLETGQGNENRKKLELIGDPDRLYKPINDDITLWLAGNSIPHMQQFHELVHGEPPEPLGLEPDYKPLKKALADTIIVKYNGGDNQSHQSHIVKETIRQIQNLNGPTSSLIVSGSSKYCAEHVSQISKCTSPSSDDDLRDVRDYGRMGMSVAIPENSQYSEGVDTPEFDMGALYNGQFASPCERFVKEVTGDSTLYKSEKIRAAQNAVLRPSNVPDGKGGITGTGKTPVIVPSRHVPEAIFTLFEEYGINVYETDDIPEMRRLILHLLERDDATEYEGDIISKNDVPPALKEFKELFGDDGGNEATG